MRINTKIFQVQTYRLSIDLSVPQRTKVALSIESYRETLKVKYHCSKTFNDFRSHSHIVPYASAQDLTIKYSALPKGNDGIM